MQGGQEETPVVLYRIDAGDRSVFVNDGWLEFAHANGTHSLERERVLDQPLWSFITGPETAHVYRMIFRAVRRSGAPAVIPFRCDSPDRRRYMSLRIAPWGRNGLEFEGRSLREELRSQVALFDTGASRGNDLLVVCSWCKRVRMDESADRWVDVEEAVRELGLFDEPRLPRLSHGICPSCAEGMEADLSDDPEA